MGGRGAAPAQAGTAIGNLVYLANEGNGSVSTISTVAFRHISPPKPITPVPPGHDPA